MLDIVIEAWTTASARPLSITYLMLRKVSAMQVNLSQAVFQLKPNLQYACWASKHVFKTMIQLITVIFDNFSVRYFF
jgi:hypothetical protein